MGLISIPVLLLVGLSFMAPVSAAKDPEESAIDARQAEMQLRAFNAGPLIAMAKGDPPYDAEMAGMLANNPKVLLSLDNGRAWRKGIYTEDCPGKTEAPPAIWEYGSEIGDRGEALEINQAGTGLVSV